jgi:hypothetical protein
VQLPKGNKKRIIECRSIDSFPGGLKPGPLVAGFQQKGIKGSGSMA